MNKKVIHGKTDKSLALKIQGKTYKPLVLEVVESDPDGTPRLFRALYEDETIATRQGMAFHIVFAQNLRARRQGTA